ncbi:MAG: hypothetical protein GX620_16720 [Chloroflexi bacterium]|nr:hypothetical protein [Chloroflexota bacterium]
MLHHIFGIHVINRPQTVPLIQACLTKYGCNIRTRIGIHDAADDSCSPSGLILVDAFGDDATVESFYQELTQLEGVEVKRMDFLREE